MMANREKVMHHKISKCLLQWCVTINMNIIFDIFNCPKFFKHNILETESVSVIDNIFI
jgi:hypothetical protein